MTSVRDQALELHNLGIQVVPALSPRTHRNFKRPSIPWQQYQDALVSREQVEQWFPPDYAGNLGIICGRASGNLFAIDIDNEEGERWWQTVCEVHNHGIPIEAPEVRTPRGGRHLFFRAPPGWTPPTLKGPGVDIRGQGGFLMGPGSLGLHDRRYEWIRSFLECEAPIAIEGLRLAIDALGRALQQAPAVVNQSSTPAPALPRVSGNGAGNGHATPSGVQNSGIVLGGELHNLGKVVDGREQHLRNILAAAHAEHVRTHGCSPMPEELAEEVWGVVQHKFELGRLGADGRPYDYRRCLEGAAQLVRRVDAGKARGLGVGEILSEVRNLGTQAPPVEALPILDVQPLGARQYHEIAPTGWIVPGLMIGGGVTMLVAPPGVGKSMMSIHMAISISTGVPWGGYTPRKTGPVLIINLEDDADTMDRRCRAAADAMGVSPEQYEGNLLFLRGASELIVSMSASGGAGAVRTPMYEALLRKCQELGVVALFADPFAETFTGDENSNSEVKFAIGAWREMARRTGAAITLVHHTKKFAVGMAGEADVSRGASALIGAARVMKTIFTMSNEEAKALLVDPEDRKKYLRLDDAKGNYSAMEKARWFERVPVNVPTSDPTISETVPFLKAWAPPGAFSGLTNEVLNDCLDVIARGEPGEDGRLTGDPYSSKKNSGRRWVGHAIMRMLDVDEERAKRIIKTWLESGLLVDEKVVGAKSREKQGLRVVDTMRPGVSVDA